MSDETDDDLFKHIERKLDKPPEPEQGKKLSPKFLRTEDEYKKTRPIVEIIEETIRRVKRLSKNSS